MTVDQVARRVRMLSNLVNALIGMLLFGIAVVIWVPHWLLVAWIVTSVLSVGITQRSRRITPVVLAEARVHNYVKGAPK